MGIGRRRVVKSPRAMLAAWDEFKGICDGNTTTYLKDVEFSKGDETVATHSETTTSAPVTYTIVGFCAFLGISRAAWYQTYEPDPKFADAIALIRTECENDVRRKFETGAINSRLAPLWMSKYGYGAKVETTNEHRADNNLLDAIKDSLSALDDGDDVNDI
jgi:hypothetical protein